MSGRNFVRNAFQKCIEAVQPRKIVQNAIIISPKHVKIGDGYFRTSSSTTIVVVAFGKASILMADGVREKFKGDQEKLLRKMIVLAPEQQKTELKKTLVASETIEIMYGAKDNLPDENSVSATRHIINEIRRLDSEETIFLFLISGGGSALLCSPKPPVTLNDKLTTIKSLQATGATIQQLNSIRQKLSEVKGGRLLEHIQKGQSVSLIISDAIGNPINLIASGPTVPIENSQDILLVENILQSLKVDYLPESVRNTLQSKSEAVFSKCAPQNFIISSNSTALQAASEFLKSSGYNVFIVSSSLSGNATEVGRQFADVIASEDFISSELLKNSEVSPNYPIALLFGGETTVKLAENPGKGGRNQEMVLSCLQTLNTKKAAHVFTFLSAGSDGQDGPTEAAGALISNDDLLDTPPTLSKFLVASDSYNFWRQFKNGDCHLITGPSGTNVMDIQILLLDSQL